MIPLVIVEAFCYLVEVALQPILPHPVLAFSDCLHHLFDLRNADHILDPAGLVRPLLTLELIVGPVVVRYVHLSLDDLEGASASLCPARHRSACCTIGFRLGNALLVHPGVETHDLDHGMVLAYPFHGFVLPGAICFALSCFSVPLPYNCHVVIDRVDRVHNHLPLQRFQRWMVRSLDPQRDRLWPSLILDWRLMRAADHWRKGFEEHDPHDLVWRFPGLISRVLGCHWTAV